MYWRNTDGDTVVESDLSAVFQNEYIYFAGLRVARRDASNNVHYYFADHLTSARVVTNATGTMPPEQDVDLTPYGGIANGSPTEHYLFTGQERDNESTLDYFGTRHYISALGRFMVPDRSGLASVDPSSPQSWNAYAYVLNNPLNLTDPNGERPCQPDDSACVIDTPPPDVLTDNSFVNAVIVERLNEAGKYAQQALHEMLNVAREWISRPRNPGCMATAMGAGSALGTAIGTKIGTLGFAGGATGLATTPAGAGTGFVLGGATGWVIGMNSCMTGSGGGGGSSGGGGGRKWKLGSFKSATKWANQMAKRGWTEAQIDEAVENGARLPAVNSVNPANAATRYVSPTTGRSVVIDNVTNEVLHVGGDGFRY